MPDCPSDADLSGFLNDSLPPERVAGVSTHVDGCPDCQNRLDKLTQDANSAVARYKELSSGSLPALVTASSPDAGTLIIGGAQPGAVNSSAKLIGLPRVPGFDVVEEIGRGGMGVVYKARHRRLNRLCALKMILAGGAADARTVQRFLYEAEILGRVQHPQVVQVFEVDTYQGPSGVPIPYLAMELLEGGSLGKRIREGALPPRAAAELIEGLARAVHTAHLQGVVHRDLKPGNILFPESGVKNQESSVNTQKIDVEQKNSSNSASSPTLPSQHHLSPKVTDFGLAKFIEAGADLTGSGQVVGTPHYMAPEQAAGSKQIGPQADVYALGAILFECLTGRPPFIGAEPMSVLLKVVNEAPPDVRSLRPEVARDLAAVVARCLEKEPRRRYQSATELADDLRRFLENRPTVARPLRRRERLWLWAKRNPAVAGLGVTLAAVVFVAFAAITWLWIKAEDTADNERHAKILSVFAEERAKKKAEEAKAALEESQKQQMIADRRQAELEFERGMTSCEQARVREGLRSFVRAVELAEKTGADDLARVARINLAAWPRELPPPRQPFPHTDQPRLAAFHPNGKQIVTAGRGSEVHLWDIATGQKVRTYKPGAIHVPFLNSVLEPVYWSVAVSPDGKTIAAGASDGRITVWNTDSAEPRMIFKATEKLNVPAPGPLSFKRGDNDVWWVDFAPDGTLWASDGLTGVKRWNLAGTKPTQLVRLTPKPGPRVGLVNVLVVSRNGKRVYTGDRAGIIREWDVEKGIETGILDASGWVQDIALSPDEQRLAATGPEGIVREFDLRTRRRILEISLDGAYGNGVAFTPKQPFLITSDGDGNVRFWHRDTGQPIGIQMRFSGEVTRMRCRPNSDQFAVPAGNAIYLSDVPDPAGNLISPGHGIRVRGLDVSPKGDRIAVSDDHILEVFDTRGKQLHIAREPGLDPLCIRIDPTERWVYRGTRDGFDRLALPAGVQAEPGASIGLSRVQRIDFARGGVIVMGTVLVVRYDPVRLEQLAASRPDPSVSSGMDLSTITVRPDGGEVLVACGSRVVFLNSETLEPSRKGWIAGDGILDAKYTPDGTKVLIARRDNRAQLLDATTGEAVIRSMPHSGAAVTSVAVSPDGKTLLTGSRDDTARFWDATSGLPLGPPLRHLGPVTHVLYDPNGKHVITGTGTGHVMLWDIPPAPATGSLEQLREDIRKRSE